MGRILNESCLLCIFSVLLLLPQMYENRNERKKSSHFITGDGTVSFFLGSVSYFFGGENEIRTREKRWHREVTGTCVEPFVFFFLLLLLHILKLAHFLSVSFALVWGRKIFFSPKSGQKNRKQLCGEFEVTCFHFFKKKPFSSIWPLQMVH